ncbi:protein MIX23 [Daphnia magna]|uniref:protein MIX23 n=1 Tax=Daphnia magna TaxID=35525 RepID=UPI001E1BB8F0|nr:protein MIX23 [Daphnia magna]
MAEMENKSICYDILQFQETLRKMRTLDDKIIYTFNTSIPTDSFKGQVNESATCKHLYDELQTNYRSREHSIKQCIDILANEVRSLKQEKDAHPDNFQLLKHLRREQTSLRLLQTELGVEEVIKERTMKVFYEHCRNYYKLPEASP